MLETLYQAREIFTKQISAGESIWLFCLSVLMLLSLMYFIRSWVYLKKRNWESKYFIIMSAPVMLWTVSSFMSGYVTNDTAYLIVNLLQYSFNILIPTFLCLHVWSQVTYKPITKLTWIGYMAVPFLLICLDAFFKLSAYSGAVIFTGITLEEILAGLYMLFVFAKSYLLCFNVFYQMPKHMRLSTFYLLTAITSLVIAKVMYIFIPDSLAFVIEVIATGLMLERFFSAFYIANSSNVIVTSREFVFGSLSTIVITVSRKGRILDWNKKGEYDFGHFPQPTYKQPIYEYKQQFIEQGNGKISPHDNNIVTANYNNVEQHFLFTFHEIKHKLRHFGYLVEISEITKVYSVLRFLEEIAMIDQLTGMYNRNAYINMARAMVSADNMPLLVMVGDVNSLKKLNDTIGHLCGDKLLIAIAKIVLETAPDGSFVARIGGDELVLLKAHGDMETAERFEEAVKNKCDQIDDPEYGTPSISWGYAIMNSLEEEYNSVFLKADIMMLDKKKLLREGSTSSGFVPPLAWE